MNRIRLNKPFSKYQRGISLIEVLITVLVLAVGLLGLSALQLASLRNNQSAMQRSLAIVHSYSIIEAIRAEPELDFNIGLTETPGSEDSFSQKMHSLWRAQLKANLGDTATGSVNCVDKLDKLDKQCTIIVQWDDSRTAQGSETEQLITEVWR